MLVPAHGACAMRVRSAATGAALPLTPRIEQPARHAPHSAGTQDTSEHGCPPPPSSAAPPSTVPASARQLPRRGRPQSPGIALCQRAWFHARGSRIGDRPSHRSDAATGGAGPSWSPDQHPDQHPACADQHLDQHLAFLVSGPAPAPGLLAGPAPGLLALLTNQRTSTAGLLAFLTNQQGDRSDPAS